MPPRGLDPPTFLVSTVCERSQTVGLVVDTEHAARRGGAASTFCAAGVEVAPLLRLEAMAGDLIAEGLDFADLIERYDAVAAARDEGYAGLKSIAAYRSGLIRRWSAAEAEEALTRQHAAGWPRAREQALVDFRRDVRCRSRAATICRFSGHAGYGDRDLDLRLVNPLHLRGMLSSEEAEGVHFVGADGGLAVRARGRVPDRGLRQRHARRRDVHPPARRPARWPGAARSPRWAPPAACTPPATPPACPSTSRRVPGARA